MAIPYQTAKFKSANIKFFAWAIWGPTTMQIQLPPIFLAILWYAVNYVHLVEYE